MNWPWRQRGNRHRWEFDNPTITVRGGINLICGRCGQTWHNDGHRFHSEPEALPPKFGCTALPLPATGNHDADALPVVDAQ